MNEKTRTADALNHCSGTYTGKREGVECIVNDKKFKVVTDGMCYWYEVIFTWLSGKEIGKDFYILKRSPADLDGVREEYFNGVIVREYNGKQNCFVEMFEMLWNSGMLKEKLPNNKLLSTVCLELGFSKSISNWSKNSFFRIVKVEFIQNI